MAKSGPARHRVRGAQTQRQLRVGEELRHSLARQFERGALRDPALTGIAITVTEVQVSPDLKHAIAFVMPLGGAKLAEVLDGLARSAGYLRREMAKEVQLRYTPELVFAGDTSFDHASRIDELLKRPDVRRDLEPGDRNKPNGT
jgi:ribosome-binding factor A